MSLTIETDLKDFLDKINDKLDTLTKDVASNQKETNAKIESFQKETNAKIDGFQKEINAKIDGFQKETNAKIDGFQKETNGKFESIQKELTDLKVDVAVIKTQVQTIEITQKSQVWVIIGGFISLVVALLSVFWRFFFKAA